MCHWAAGAHSVSQIHSTLHYNPEFNRSSDLSVFMHSGCMFGGQIKYRTVWFGSRVLVSSMGRTQKNAKCYVSDNATG